MKSQILKFSGGKKLGAVKEKVDQAKFYSLSDAIKFLQKNKFVKFDESLDIVLCLGIDVSKSDQNVRGVVSLPHGTGKTVRVAAFVNEKDVAAAKKAGADLAGLEDLIEDIKKEKIDFDVCVATPDVMAKVSAVAKILGPKGLMPNPKLGTVGADIADVIKRVKAGQVEYCADKAGIIHVGVGKLSFGLDALEENVRALIAATVRSKPSGLKVPYFKAVFIGSTMGPSLKLESAGLDK